MKKIQVSKILFFALAAVLPVNLGKHFEFSGRSRTGLTYR